MNEPTDIAEYGEVTTGPIQPEVLPLSSNALMLIRAEIDQMQTLAKASPRQVKQVISEIREIATMDQELAAECMYALPRGKKPIRGMSIRFAEILMYCFGNCRVSSYVTDINTKENYIEAIGVFQDLQKNVQTSAKIMRGIADRYGKTYSRDMIMVTGNAAAAIARRNSILSGVNRAVFWRDTEAAVMRMIVGDSKTLTERRENAIRAFANFGVTADQILAALDVRDVESITGEHMPTLIGMHNALKGGETTVEEMFPRVTPAIQSGQSLQDKLKPTDRSSDQEKARQDIKDAKAAGASEQSPGAQK